MQKRRSNKVAGLRGTSFASIAFVAFAAIFLLGACSPVKPKEPLYKLVDGFADERIERRLYPAITVAEITVAGEQREAIEQGFRALFDYINGQNRLDVKIPLSNPVTGDTGSVKIAMTAPVLQTTASAADLQLQQQLQQQLQPNTSADTNPSRATESTTTENASKIWTISFVMPDNMKLNTLPRPSNANIKLREIPERPMAAVIFSGRATAATLRERSEYLQKFAKKHNWQTIGQPLYAFYDPPFTLPFLRRNEVLIELSPSSLNELIIIGR